MINPDATIGHIYDKHHLVPFGEYLPFGDFAYRWLGISAFAAQEGNGYSAGQGPVLLDLGPKLGLALPLICYEAVFPQDLRAAKGRANFIMQLTNDAWFGKLTGPWQHLAQARLRAIEQGLPFLRSANTGVSAVIDARGRVLSHLPMGVAGHLDTALPTALAATFYAGTGDLPFLVLLIGLLALVVFVPKRLRP
jgi:apolipoprotein N-acyltransferase